MANYTYTTGAIEERVLARMLAEQKSADPVGAPADIPAMLNREIAVLIRRWGAKFPRDDILKIQAAIEGANQADIDAVKTQLRIT